MKAPQILRSAFQTVTGALGLRELSAQEIYDRARAHRVSELKTDLCHAVYGRERVSEFSKPQPFFNEIVDRAYGLIEPVKYKTVATEEERVALVEKVSQSLAKLNVDSAEIERIVHETEFARDNPQFHVYPML